MTTLLLAWLLATGAQWDLVQTYAWGRMFLSYSRSVPVSQALRMTFEPGNMCSVCRAVDRARHQEQGPSVPGSRTGAKLMLCLQPASSIVIATPSREAGISADQSATSAPRESPPTPPPRVA